MTDAQTYPQPLVTLHYPDPRLRRPSNPVTVFDAALVDFCQRLLEHMYAEKGVGLAAPQVGVLQRIFVTDHAQKDGQPGEPTVFINPRVVEARGESVYEEGCLSVPGLYAKVKRPNAITFAWQDVQGAEHSAHFDITGGDFLGTVCLHELDHLDGTLFVDHLAPVQVNLLRRKLRDLEKAYHRATGQSGAPLRR